MLTALTACLVFVPAEARADGLVPPTVTVNCSPAGPGGGCSGWFKTDVTVTFSWTTPPGESFYSETGCNGFRVTADTKGEGYDCVVTLQDGTGAKVSNPDLIGSIERDTTPPSASGIVSARAPDANGWYNHPVGLSVSGTDATSGIASCTTTTYSGPDTSSATVNGTCTDNAGNVSAPVSVSLKYDATAPSVTSSPSRSPDANGWYSHEVDLAFKGSDSTSGIVGCTSASYSGPDNGNASVTGSCTDQAGNTGTASFALKYDATPPTVTGATADRPPDSGGFYNHKVTVTFAGSDATSGVASCDVVPYDKPDSAPAKVTGVCHDNAGNTSAPLPFAFKYDSTPPKLTGLTADAENGAVALAFKPSADVAAVTVTRSADSSSPKTVYSGKRITALVDKGLRNGTTYSYTVVATDDAGNAVTARARVSPSAPLISPRQEARVRGSVMLRWRSVTHAGYYNVQLWYRGAKVLSVWPSGLGFHVPGSWSYLDRVYRLLPGRYTWFVWPGLGSRSAHRFGKLLGSSSFVVTG